MFASARLHPQLEGLHRLFFELARLIADRAAAVTVEVAVHVAAAHDFVATLAEDVSSGLSEEGVTSLVPEDDAIGPVRREYRLTAAGDSIEGLVYAWHGVSLSGPYRPFGAGESV